MLIKETLKKMHECWQSLFEQVIFGPKKGVQHIRYSLASNYVQYFASAKQFARVLACTHVSVQGLYNINIIILIKSNAFFYLLFECFVPFDEQFSFITCYSISKDISKPSLKIFLKFLLQSIIRIRSIKTISNNFGKWKI